MRISDVAVHRIAIADPPLRSSYGLHQPYALRTILEVKSEDGLVGIAETYGGEAPADALEKLKPRLLGANPFKLTGTLVDMVEGKGSGDARSQTMLVPGENPLDATARTFSAVETACLDLIGKATGQPLCDLIGGRVRDAVPFSAYPFYKHAGGGGEGDDAREDEYGEALSPEGIVAQVRQLIAKYGFKDIKFKTGVLDPDIEIESVRALRKEFGLPVRMDPNCAWSVETSIRVGKELREELGAATGGYLEDPTASISGMAAVRRALLDAGCNVPLASNVAVTCFADLPQAIREDAVQIVLCDHHYWGGMRQVQHLAKICATWGLGLSMHSNSHLGVSLMAMTHVAAATPHLSYACDTHYPWSQAKDEIVVGGRIKFVEGSVPIPDKPGLGVELDYDQLARGRERYVKCPYRKRDDTAEMRKHVDTKLGAAPAAVVMRRRVKVFAPFAAALLGFAVASCSVNSVPITTDSETLLREHAISGEKLGFHIMPGGQRYRLALFRAHLPEHPVEVPMDRSLGGLPTIRMSLNHTKPVRFVADTGAQLSVVEANIAIAARAEVYAPKEGTLRVEGIGGEERAWLARFASAQLGPMEFGNLVTVLRRETSAMRFGGMRVGGFDVNLLGAPVVSAFSFVTFDYRAKRMMFSGSAAFVPSRGAVRVPMEMRDSLPHVPVQINGRTYSALVDTGARDQLFLNEDIVRELGLEATASSGGTFKAAGLGGMIRGRTFRLPLIYLGGMPVPDVNVDSSGGPWRVRIGSELLERWRTTFDFRNRALWLEVP